MVDDLCSYRLSRNEFDSCIVRMGHASKVFLCSTTSQAVSDHGFRSKVLDRAGCSAADRQRDRAAADRARMVTSAAEHDHKSTIVGGVVGVARVWHRNAYE